MSKYKKNKESKRPPEESYDGIIDVDISSDGDPYKDIIFNHIANVMRYSSVEFRGGYWTKVVDKMGNEREIYIPDTRDIYCNACYSLALILLPKFDDQMKKDYDDFKKKKKDLKQSFIDQTEIEEDVVLGEGYYQSEKDKLLLESYKQKKLEIHLFLFAKITLFLGRINFMQIVGGIF